MQISYFASWDFFCNDFTLQSINKEFIPLCCQYLLWNGFLYFILYHFQTDYDDRLKYLKLIIQVLIVTSSSVRKREQLSGCLIFPISITTFSLALLVTSPLLRSRVNSSTSVAALTAANIGLNTASCPPGDISGILLCLKLLLYYLPIWEFCQSPFLLNEFNQWALYFWKLESFSMNILSFQQV